MGAQEQIWATSEGDAWFERNIWKMEENAAHDPVIKAIMTHLNRDSRVVMEMGCSNGWRLGALKKVLDDTKWAFPNLVGIDPSMSAIANGSAKFKDVQFHRGTATAFPEGYGALVDLLIYGFCLYACDPEDHFEIATQGNNLLVDNGVLIIHDFDPEYPHSVPNHHVDGLMTYKYDWSQLWLHHPSYRLLEKQSFPDGTAIWVLKKRLGEAFPLCSSEFSGSAPSEIDTPET